jgi:hypothetical protein
MKDPRMKKKIYYFSFYLRGVCNFNFFHLLSLEFIKRDGCSIYYSSTLQEAWKLSKSLEEDSSIDCTTPRRTPKMKRVDYYLEDIQKALV